MRAATAEATAERLTCCSLQARNLPGNESTTCCSAAVADMMDRLPPGSGQGMVEQPQVWDFRARKGELGKLEAQRRGWAGKAAGRQRGHIRAQSKGGCCQGVEEGKVSMATREASGLR